MMAMAGTQQTPSPNCGACGMPLDSQVFDVSGFTAPKIGNTHVLARFELPSRYCGVLEFFSQFTDVQAKDPSEVETPGLDWSIRLNGRPLYPYLSFNRILNPWGFGSFQTGIRLSDSSVLEFIVRPTQDSLVKKVGARLVGRFWHNSEFGDVMQPR